MRLLFRSLRMQLIKALRCMCIMMLDEWMYIFAGEFVAEVGGKKMRLKPGDSLLMPMRVPHRWSVAGTPTSGGIHAYTPAGKMDVFFETPKSRNGKPFSHAELTGIYTACGMTLLGDSLTKEEIDQV